MSETKDVSNEMVEGVWYVFTRTQSTAPKLYGKRKGEYIFYSSGKPAGAPTIRKASVHYISVEITAHELPILAALTQLPEGMVRGIELSIEGGLMVQEDMSVQKEKINHANKT